MRDRKADNLIRRQLWLEQCAWANRQVMTPSELRLWSALKARQLGAQFRREVPLAGRYIVDFCAPSVRLVVEVDGAITSCGRALTRAEMRSFAGSGIACCASRRRSSCVICTRLWRWFARCCECVCRARFTLPPNSSGIARPGCRTVSRPSPESAGH